MVEEREATMPGRIRAIVASILLGVIAAPAIAQDAGRISRVVLYPGSAAIERTARVAAGSSRLEMTGLPASFDLRTLRVEADSGIVVGEVAVQDVSRAEALSGREAELEARIESLKDEKAALEVEVKTAELVRNYLAALSSRGAETEKAQPMVLDPKSIPAVIDAIRRGGGDAYGQIQRIEIKKRGLDKQVAVLERDLARLRSGGRDARTLAISYTATRAGEIRASYQVANAGWKPTYRAALDSSSSRVELERQAIIMQRTGEDWRGVALRLSTGQPRAARIVDPAPWQLVIRPPVRALESQVASPAATAVPEARRALADKASRAEEPAPIVAQFQTQFTTEFEVAGKVDLAADGRQVNVSLARQSIPVKQRIRVVPRQDSTAMVTAEAELPEGVWIPGDAQLYRDGSYIGSTFWNAQAKEKLVLPFGRDERIVVASNRTKNRSGPSGFIGQRNERQIADLYTVTSRHKVPVDLLLLEAAPVAVSDQISVEVDFQPKPKVQDWEEKRGVVAWEQPLQPGETLKFVADYIISYPKDVAVIGLP
jgi:uncharacterized protein (TIGR02231 family)